MNITATVHSRGLDQLLSRLSREARTSLAQSGLYGLEVGVRTHLARASLSRHSTAARLGASPTGHLEKAAQAVRTELAPGGIAAGAGNPSVGAVIVESPGIARALRPVRIVPRLARALTIPIHALAYGRRAAEVERLTGERLFRPVRSGGRKTNILAATINGQLVPLYALVRSVTLPHDPGLLPTAPELGGLVRSAMLRRLAQITAA